MKKIFLNTKYALYTVWRVKKNVYFISFILLFWGVVYSLINTVAPAQIINFLYPKFQLTQAISLIVVWCSTQAINSLLCGKLNDILSISALKITARVKAQYGRVVSDLPYEQLESSQTQDDIEFTKKGLSNGCEFQVVRSLFGSLQSVISVVFLLSILTRLSYLYFILTVIITISETVVKAIVEKKRYEFDVNHENTSRKLNYAIWGLTDCSLGKEIRLFNLARYVQNKFNKERNSMYHELAGRTKILAKYYFLPSLLMGVLYFSVYGMTAYSVYLGMIDVGDFVLLTSGILSFHQLLTSFVDNIISIKTHTRYIERYRILSVTEKKEEKKLEIDTSNIKIEFRHVWFKYPNQPDYAIKDCNFSFSGKEKIAVVGENGSGKSTFIKLMIGFYRPAKGSILINNINIENISRKDLKEIFAPVFQDYFFTAYSVRDNLVWDDPQVDDFSVFNVLHQVGVEEAIKNLPGELDCAMSKQLDDKGCELSGGESQKIALARAILKNSPVLILDEPTAALSPIAEYEIYQNFRHLSENKSAIFISHRMAACKLCDRILVFHGGSIVEEGSHNSLMALNGIYRNMFDTQSNYYKET